MLNSQYFIFTAFFDNALLLLHWKMYLLMQSRKKSVSYCFYSSMSSGFVRDATQLSKEVFSALTSN